MINGESSEPRSMASDPTTPASPVSPERDTTYTLGGDAPTAPIAAAPSAGEQPADVPGAAYHSPALDDSRAKAGGPSTVAAVIIGAIIGAVVVGVVSFFLLGAYVTKGTSNGSSSTGITTGGNKVASVTATSAADLSVAVAQKTLPSVVSIDVAGVNQTDAMSGQTYSTSASGSGVVIRKDGYILTNYHVIEGGSSIKVTVGSKTYTARTVGTDSSTDLAVLKIAARNLTVADIGTSQGLQVGQYVMAVGSPFGLSNSVSSGIISALGRSNMIQNQTQISTYVNLIQTDAAINPGNSGGALVNESGQLVGINTLISSTSGSSAGIGFAIPVDTAIDIANQLITTGHASHPFLGVSTQSVTEEVAATYNLPTKSGAYVVLVSGNSPAAIAGLKRGDIIVSIGGKTVTSSEDVFTDVRSHAVGDTVTVKYYRGKTLKSVQAKLVSDTSVKKTSSTGGTNNAAQGAYSPAQ